MLDFDYSEERLPDRVGHIEIYSHAFDNSFR